MIFTLVGLAAVLAVVFFVLRKTLEGVLYDDCDSMVYLGGKTALVTGGSSGLGYLIVQELASRGCKVIIADKISDESIKDGLIKKTHNPSITIHHLDLASFDSVRKFAEDLKKTEQKIDILFNNAGIGASGDNLTEDGLNFVYQVNYYGAFLLTHLLVDLLKKSDSARILFTSSPLAYLHQLNNSDEKQLTTCSHLGNYANTKCMMVMASDIFAEKLKRYNITSNAWHPIGAATSIFSSSAKATNQSGMAFATMGLWLLAVLLAPDARKTIQRAIYLACSDEAKDVTGEFYRPTGKAWKPFLVKDKEFCQKLWKVSEKVTKLRPEEKL